MPAIHLFRLLWVNFRNRIPFGLLVIVLNGFRQRQWHLISSTSQTKATSTILRSRKPSKIGLGLSHKKRQQWRYCWRKRDRKGSRTESAALGRFYARQI